jgi:hypothetical protein
MSTPIHPMHKWDLTLVDAGDGTGDCFIEIPPELLNSLGWGLDDVVSVEIVEQGLFVTKVRTIKGPY